MSAALASARYSFVDFPVAVERAAYDAAVARMSQTLLGLPGVRAVYQVGGVSSPGISDLDIVAVFADDALCTVDPRAGLSAADRYLFVHDLYGVAAGQLADALRYSAFHNYRFVGGEPLPGVDGMDGAAAAGQELKTQIALEFLLRMFTNMAMQHTTGLVKLRSFLLQAKAIRYDLEFLGIKGGRLLELTDEVIDIRDRWFSEPVPAGRLSTLVAAYHEALCAFLGDALRVHRLYLPERRSFALSPWHTLKASGSLAWEASGEALPAVIMRLSPLLVRVQNRLCRFVFEVPAHAGDMPPAVAGRFRLVRELREHNRRRLPHFAVLTSSLNV